MTNSTITESKEEYVDLFKKRGNSNTYRTYATAIDTFFDPLHERHQRISLALFLL